MIASKPVRPKNEDLQDERPDRENRAVEQVLIVLPAWNEQEALPAVLDEIHSAVPLIDVLVVNDGSTDLTSQAARSRVDAVLDLVVNLGVGGAMRAGFKCALREGYDAVVQLDADGQHNPRSASALLATARSKAADVVIGARFTGTGAFRARGPRRWATWGLSTVSPS